MSMFHKIHTSCTIVVEHAVQLPYVSLMAKNSFSDLSCPTDTHHIISWLFNGGGGFIRKEHFLFLLFVSLLEHWALVNIFCRIRRLKLCDYKWIRSDLKCLKKRGKKWTAITSGIYWTFVTLPTLWRALCTYYNIYYSQKQSCNLNTIILPSSYIWEKLKLHKVKWFTSDSIASTWHCWD